MTILYTKVRPNTMPDSPCANCDNGEYYPKTRSPYRCTLLKTTIQNGEEYCDLFKEKVKQ